ncbi:hypothetical protein MMC28_005248 [Mycoblastus sanguinarius]|nr:hypothetical protein [Mycoblastus sanguinarius]
MKIFKATYLAVYMQLNVLALTAQSPAPPLNAPGSSLQLLSGALNSTTLAFNSTLPTSANRPPDPYDWRDPGRSLTVEFYSYGAEIPTHRLRCCFDVAYQDIATRRADPDAPIAANELRYSALGVYLVLYPGANMTWWIWMQALGGTSEFVFRRLNVALSFIVLEDGFEGEVGKGWLGL